MSIDVEAPQTQRAGIQCTPQFTDDTPLHCAPRRLANDVVQGTGVVHSVEEGQRTRAHQRGAGAVALCGARQRGEERGQPVLRLLRDTRVRWGEIGWVCRGGFVHRVLHGRGSCPSHDGVMNHGADDAGAVRRMSQGADRATHVVRLGWPRDTCRTAGGATRHMSHGARRMSRVCRVTNVTRQGGGRATHVVRRATHVARLSCDESHTAEGGPCDECHAGRGPDSPAHTGRFGSFRGPQAHTLHSLQVWDIMDGLFVILSACGLTIRDTTGINPVASLLFPFGQGRARRFQG